MPSIIERMAALEEGGKSRDRRLEAIEHSMGELAGLVRELGRAFDRLVAQDERHHAQNQATIAAVAATVAKLEPIVTTHEQERQQALGRKTLLIGAISLGAGAVGGIAGAVTAAAKLAGGN